MRRFRDQIDGSNSALPVLRRLPCLLTLAPDPLAETGSGRSEVIQLTAPTSAWFGGVHVHVRLHTAFFGHRCRHFACDLARQRDQFRHLVCHRDNCVRDFCAQAPVPATSELTQH